MRICKTLCLILSVLILFLPLTEISAAEIDLTVVNGCHSVDAALPVGGNDKLVETSKAVIVYERTTGTMIYTYNADQTIYPSSMVKLMTAIVALEQAKMDDVVTVTRSALDSVAIGSVSAGLKRGEEITIGDLLYCMMVASANDAAAVIAEHIAGGQAGFVMLMNEKASQLGCDGTHFSNVHGLHEDDNYTTARDVLKILEYGLSNPEFKAMFETVSYTVPATNKSDPRKIATTNYMMSKGKYYDARVTGGKTGATDEAGRCLAVTADVGDMELVAVVMGAKATYSEDGLSVERFGSFEEMEEILDHVQDHFECRQLYYEGQVIAQYPVSGGRNNVVTMPVSGGYCVIPKNITMNDLTWNYAATVQDLSAPVKAGQIITAMEIWYGDVCLSKTDLVAMNSVAVYEPYSEPQSTTDEKNEQAHGKLLAQILGVVLIAIVVVLVGMFLVRILQMALLKARVRRRRKNRRRNRNARME